MRDRALHVWLIAYKPAQPFPRFLPIRVLLALQQAHRKQGGHSHQALDLEGLLSSIGSTQLVEVKAFLFIPKPGPIQRVQRVRQLDVVLRKHACDVRVDGAKC